MAKDLPYAHNSSRETPQAKHPVEGAMRKGSGEKGFTLVEVMIAAAVIAVGLLGVVSSIASSLQLIVNSRETQSALAGARRKVEEIRDAGLSATTFSSVRSYDGSRFAVSGLTLPTGVTACGLVTFLSEQAAATALGLASVDLNGNGSTADAVDDSFNAYAIRVSVSWTTEMGASSTSRARSIELITLVARSQ
jgi:prepilin-type N-terminal cleavage/methylation domain-containing protein